MKIDGIPLVFCMHDTWTLADIDEMKSEAKKAGIPEIYLVIMEWTGAKANQKCNDFNAQATSSYCNWGDGGISYSSFAKATEQKWDTYKDLQNAFIPFVTTGWDPRPIIEYYHEGKIFVLNSDSDGGTTIRIVMKKQRNIQAVLSPIYESVFTFMM